MGKPTCEVNNICIALRPLICLYGKCRAQELAACSSRSRSRSIENAENGFSAAAVGGITVDMIIKNVGHEGQAHLSFTMQRDDLEQCLLLTNSVLKQWTEFELNFEREIAKLSVMGIGPRSHTGVGKEMLRGLADAQTNIQMINTIEIRMSAVVASECGERAEPYLLKTFGLEKL